MIVIEDTLEAMQNVVGGLIQAIYPWEDPVALICNEEGKNLGLSLNRALMNPETGEIYEIIAGDFFLCGLGADRFDSLGPELAEKYRRLFCKPELYMSFGHGVVDIQGETQN